jgi:hypothetical protein
VSAFDLLCAKARLNCAVWRARQELRSARAGSHHARAEVRAGRGHRSATEAIEREARAEGALEAAVAAWSLDARRIADEHRKALPERLRYGGAGILGATFADALAALTLRFGEPSRPAEYGQRNERGAYWTRDMWRDGEHGERMRCAWRSFGVCEDFVERGEARVRIFGRASASGSVLWGAADVDVVVGLESGLRGLIEHAYLNPGVEYVTADPGPYRPWPIDPWLAKARKQEEESAASQWRGWGFDAPETAAGLLRRSEGRGPMIAPLALAVDAVALMLDVPQPRPEGAP